MPCLRSFNKRHVFTMEDLETHTINKDEVFTSTVLFSGHVRQG